MRYYGDFGSIDESPEDHYDSPLTEDEAELLFAERWMDVALEELEEEPTEEEEVS